MFVCLVVFNATFNNIKLYHGVQFCWWRKLEDPEKTTDPSKVTDKHYRPDSRFDLTKSVVIATDCIVSWKSTYHNITTTTVPHTSFDKEEKNIHFINEYYDWWGKWWPTYKKWFRLWMLESTSSNRATLDQKHTNYSSLLFSYYYVVLCEKLVLLITFSWNPITLIFINMFWNNTVSNSFIRVSLVLWLIYPSWNHIIN